MPKNLYSQILPIKIVISRNSLTAGSNMPITMAARCKYYSDRTVKAPTETPREFDKRLNSFLDACVRSISRRQAAAAAAPPSPAPAYGCSCICPSCVALILAAYYRAQIIQLANINSYYWCTAGYCHQGYPYCH